jgi:sarcosine oxidase delta subunit
MAMELDCPYCNKRMKVEMYIDTEALRKNLKEKREAEKKNPDIDTGSAAYKSIRVRPAK